jgi:hypothetical protein
MDRIKEQHQILCEARKSATETLAMIRQAFGEESMSRKRVFEWHSQFRADIKKETAEGQSQEHAHHFL